MCEVDKIQQILIKKTTLVQMYIVVKYINIFRTQINGIIDDKGNAILNFLPFINCKYMYVIDKAFYEFLNVLESWWQNPFNNLHYEHTK